MRPRELLCDQREPTPGKRLERGLGRLWDHLQAKGERFRSQAAEERQSAAALLAELMELSTAEQRLESIEREPRFWTLGLSEHLLAVARPADPEIAQQLADLALALVRRLDPQRYDETLLIEQEVVAWSLWAEAHRRQGDFVRAESSLERAARRLATEPLDLPERATFCRYLARLRHEQGREDEALGLLQRAAELFEKWKTLAEAGEAWSELGRLCLDAGDPVSAQEPLEKAVKALQKTGVRTARVHAWQGLALCYAELSLAEEAERALAAARALYERRPAGVEALRDAVIEARVAERLGQIEEALSRLRAALPGFLLAGAAYDAAVAALELAEIYAALGRTGEVERLRTAVVSLSEPDALPDRALSVLLFALQLASRPDRDATELLAEAGEFLERARERPWLRFAVAGEPRTELFWGLLAPGERRAFCVQAGLPAGLADRADSEITAAERDLLTWTQEALAGVRISFAPPSGPAGEPAPEAA